MGAIFVTGAIANAPGSRDLEFNLIMNVYEYVNFVRD
jgi:hypothetical protein